MATPAGIVDRATLTIARLHRALEHTPDTELTLPHYRVLGLLAAGDERASVLASRLAVSRPTVTALVDSLVERGFVTREPGTSDRRSITVSITADGRAAVAATGVALRATLDAVLAGCADRTVVDAALEQLAPALDLWFTARTAAKG
ncbi:MAG TPA: MarR family transcriptional regulator [Ilumatobacteraceae bacterium]|nr:MarR family transcriptional regulator [Ilumatobacteraceae bacterium]